MAETRKRRQKGKNTLPNPYSLIEMKAVDCLTRSHLHAKITTFLSNPVEASISSNNVSTHGLPLHHGHLRRAPTVGRVEGHPARLYPLRFLTLSGSKVNTPEVRELL